MTLVLVGGAVSAGGRQLLRDVELSLERGSFAALVGPSGAGKSTLLRAIAGLVDLDEGQVTLAGETPEALGWPAFRRRCVYVHQRPQLLADSVQSNLARAFEFATASAEFSPEAAREGLSALGLDPEILAREARSLSVGEQQRVCLVRASLVQPDFLLLDEPTSALDPESTAAVEAWLGREREGESRPGVLAVTHDHGQAERLGGMVLDVTEWRVPQTGGADAG